MIHMKCQDLFSLKSKVNLFSAAAVIGALRVKSKIKWYESLQRQTFQMKLVSNTHESTSKLQDLELLKKKKKKKKKKRQDVVS